MAPLSAVHAAMKLAKPDAAKPSSHSTTTMSVVTPAVVVALRVTFTGPQFDAAIQPSSIILSEYAGEKQKNGVRLGSEVKMKRENEQDNNR